MINPNSPEGQKLISAFKMLEMTPEGQIIMQYLQSQFLYPNPALPSLCDNQAPSNDEKLGHHRVILHMLAMIDQPLN